MISLLHHLLGLLMLASASDDCHVFLENISLGLPEPAGFYHVSMAHHALRVGAQPLIQLLNDRLAARSFGALSDEKLKGALLSGAEIPEVVVAVHQEEFEAINLRLQTATVRWLNSDPSLSHVPRLLLVSPCFNIRRHDFREEASLIQISLDGHFKIPLNTDKIHIVGGQWNNCLMRAVSDAIRQSLAFSQRQTVEIVLHLMLIYDQDYIIFHRSARYQNRQLFAKLLALDLQRMAGEGVIPVITDSDHQFTFIRQSDGKRINFHLVD